MKKSLVVLVFAWIATLVGALPAAAAPPRGTIYESLPHTQANWVCIADQFAQGIPLATALDNCAVSLVGPNGEKVGAGLSNPYGGFLGHGDDHYYSELTVACGSGNPLVGDDGGTPATKAEVDKMMMEAWKQFLKEMEAKQPTEAEKARETYEKLKVQKEYAPKGGVGPLSDEQCRQLQEAVRELDQQVQKCDQDGWQSSYDCAALAAVLFGCADPTVSLTTGDYRCGGKPTESEVADAAEQVYLLCSALARGVDPDSDPCKAATADKGVLQAVLFEHDKCHDPQARWAENCGTPIDLGKALEGEVAKVSPGFHDALVQLCKLAGGPACLGPPSGDGRGDPGLPGDPRPGPGGPK